MAGCELEGFQAASCSDILAKHWVYFGAKGRILQSDLSLPQSCPQKPDHRRWSAWFKWFLTSGLFLVTVRCLGCSLSLLSRLVPLGHRPYHLSNKGQYTLSGPSALSAGRWGKDLFLRLLAELHKLLLRLCEEIPSFLHRCCLLLLFPRLLASTQDSSRNQLWFLSSRVPVLWCALTVVSKWIVNELKWGAKGRVVARPIIPDCFRLSTPTPNAIPFELHFHGIWHF